MNGKRPYMDYPQYRAARRLVHECCNYDNGNCILLDNGEPCVCVQSISYSLLCRWFIAAVLPLDGKLEAALLHRADRKRCNLKQYRNVTYTNILISGKLNTYLADIDRQAQERFERLIEGMKQAQGITERLKEENALEWIGQFNSIRACAREIVNEEIIYA